jgi:O-antigen/teichoic acid export membrane protein
MLKDIVHLSKQSGLYGAGQFLIKGSAIFLLPIYTSHLSVAEYGIIGLLAPISLLLMYIFSLGMSGAIIRYDAIIIDKKTQRIAHGSAWLAIIFFVILLTLLLCAVALIFWKDYFPEIPLLLGILTIITVALDATNVVPMALLRARGKAFSYSTILLLRFLLMASLIILFVVTFKMGVKGQVLAMLITSFVFSIICIVITLRYIKISFCFSWIKKYLKFGIPTVFSGIAVWALSQSNILILYNFSTLNDVALYSLALKFGLILEVFSVAIITALEPFFYKKANSFKGIDELAQISTYFLFFIMCIGSFIVLGAESLLGIIATPDYYGAGQLVPLVIITSMFRSMYLLSVQAISFKMKTKYLPYIDSSAAIINISCSFLLIPYIGIEGAIISSLFSYLLLYLGTLFIAQKLIFIPYQYSRWIKIIIIFSISIWTLSKLNFDSEFQTLFIRFLLLVPCVSIGIIVFKVLKQSEIIKIKSILRQLYI